MHLESLLGFNACYIEEMAGLGLAFDEFDTAMLSACVRHHDNVIAEENKQGGHKSLVSSFVWMS